MTGETILTICGNLTADPVLHYTTAGKPFVTLTVATKPRQYDRDAGQWRDGEPLFQRCTAWAQLAENTAATLHRGARVIAHGRLGQRSYTTDTGDKRTVTELDLDDIGPSLRMATATVTKTTGRPAEVNNDEC